MNGPTIIFIILLIIVSVSQRSRRHVDDPDYPIRQGDDYLLLGVLYGIPSALFLLLVSLLFVIPGPVSLWLTILGPLIAFVGLHHLLFPRPSLPADQRPPIQRANRKPKTKQKPKAKHRPHSDYDNLPY